MEAQGQGTIEQEGALNYVKGNSLWIGKKQ